MSIRVWATGCLTSDLDHLWQGIVPGFPTSTELCEDRVRTSGDSFSILMTLKRETERERERGRKGQTLCQQMKLSHPVLGKSALRFPCSAINGSGD